MLKYIEFALGVVLDTWEFAIVALCAGPLVWFFGVVGVLPRFEFWTSVYVALWAYTLFVVAYEMIRHEIEERARRKAALFLFNRRKRFRLL